MKRTLDAGPGHTNARVPVYAALLTPLAADGTTDIPALQAHARDLLDEGIDGFLICGTTGEGPLLEDDEVVEVTRAVVSASQGRGHVMTQIGRPSTQASARLLTRALEAGADSVVAVAPYYYALEDAQVEAHYAALRERAGAVPLFAYSIPRRTGNDLHPALVARLAALGISGIKDSTRSLERHREYIAIARAQAPGSFAVYMGSDGFVLQALRGGSDGIVSAVANAHPRLLVELRGAVAAGQNEEAARLQAEIDGVRESLQATGSIGALKAAVAGRLGARGVHYSHDVRFPLGAPA